MGLLDLFRRGASSLAGLFRPSQQAANTPAANHQNTTAAAPANAYQPGQPDPGHLQRQATSPVAAQPESRPATNRADFERYKDELRAQMEKPHTTNPGLGATLDRLYRPGATVGSGSTAAAVREESRTGGSVGGKQHTQKAQDSVVELQRWLRQNPTASPGDRAAAENVLRDTQNALNGK